MASLDTFHAPARALTDHFRRVPLFAALPSDHRDCLELLRAGALFDVPTGVEVVSAGDAPALLVVTDGALANEGDTLMWATGSHFGVAESLAGLPFAGAIRTVAPTLLYRLDGRLVGEMINRCPIIALSLSVDGTPASSGATRSAHTVPRPVSIRSDQPQGDPL